jgi:hypothetical protein
MSHTHYNIEFAKQYRNECGLYSPVQEFQYGNVLVKQVAGDEAEMAELGKRITEKFFNSHLIYHLLHTLKNDDFPAARRLLNKVTALRKECEAYLQQEPYTAHYYHDHIAMFQSFSELIDAFNTDFQEQVYSQLNQYYATLHTSTECPVAESSSIAEVIGSTEFYLKNILAYYNYFIVTWQSEANNNNDKGVQLATYMGDHLQALIVYTEEMVACIENTRSLLLTWVEKMEIKEEQELYN